MNKLTILLFFIATIKTTNSNEEEIQQVATNPEKSSKSIQTESISDEELSGNITASSKSPFSEADLEYVKNSINEINPELLESKEIKNGSIIIEIDVSVKNFANNDTYSDVMKIYNFEIKGENCEDICTFDVSVFGNNELKDSSVLGEQIQSCLELLNGLLI